MQADLIFVNGQVITVDAHNRICQGLAVRDGRIVAVGSNGAALEWQGPGTRVVDLKGASLLPGLNDAHCHILGVGAARYTLDLKWPAVKSIAEIKARVAEAARTQPPGTWIRGRGYNQNKLEEGRHPTRADLDEVAPNHPVMLVRTCGHFYACNSRALELAGIHDNTPDPEGGRLDREPSGRPNGVLREAARYPVKRVSEYSDAELLQAFKWAQETYLSYGITSCQDMDRAVTVRRLQQMHRELGLKLRVYAVVAATLDAPLLPELKFLEGDEWFRIGHFKLFADGSSSGPAAATRQPYTREKDNHGILIYSQEDVNEMYTAARRRGFALTAHAVGDRGIEVVLNGIEAAEMALPPEKRGKVRHRIEHAAMAFPDLRRRMKQLNVIAVAQPVFMYEFGDGYVQDYGPDRAAGMFPVRSLLREGVGTACSSDAPVTYPDPWLGLSITMSRKTQTGRVVGPDERLTFAEALRLYTLGGAYAAYEEKEKGSLEVGKLADLVAVNAPVLRLGPDEVRHVRPMMTVVGGEVVYEQS